MLEIKELFAKADGAKILKGLNLVAKPGEIHAIMGPNGSGKSTLAKVLTGHPFYEVESGSVKLDGEEILEMDPEERAQSGLFMSFQYPLEIAGITNFDFLLESYRATKKVEISKEAFRDQIQSVIEMMGIKESFLERYLNDGFSGGEKKRNEILQMMVLDPKYAILDETDSGLDIDALKVVSDGVNQYMDDKKVLIVITHYQRLLDYIKPDFVHVMIDGQITKSGGAELALELEEKGYMNAS